MPQKMYALLVGIDDYIPEVGKLQECENDVNTFHYYLTDNFKGWDLKIEKRLNSEATRAEIIKQFRNHLGKAKKGEVALFHYCGHGARWGSAKQFHKYYPDGKDEGLVCYDSRTKGGTYPYDLADKELAVLLHDLAKNNPHIAVILDCCHSGSGTRDVDDFAGRKIRQTHEVTKERPLDSYLEEDKDLQGYYATLNKKSQELFIPRSKHILLAACDRTQKAGDGVFTSTLTKVLDKYKGDLTYVDLFIKIRAAVRQYADSQDPQFEVYENFNSYTGFLGRDASFDAPRYSVYFDFDNLSWKINCGAIHGIPTDKAKDAHLALYREDDLKKVVGNVSPRSVGVQESVLDMPKDLDRERKVSYKAQITSMPVEPLFVYLHGDAKGTKILKDILKKDHSIGIEFVDNPEAAKYTLSAENDQFLLKLRETDLLVQGAKKHDQPSANWLFHKIKQVVRWERSLALQNRSTKMDTSKVDFTFSEILNDGKEHIYPGQEITLDYVQEGKEPHKIRFRVKAHNHTDQDLHLSLFYFSQEYGVFPLKNDPLGKGEEVILYGDDPSHYLALPPNVNESVIIFKLIVSTEKIDDFLLKEQPLELGFMGPDRIGLGGVDVEIEKYKNEWFTKLLRVRLVRQVDQVSNKPVSVANKQITIKAHNAVKAKVSVSAAKSNTRAAGDGSGIYKVLEKQGMEMLNFSATRGGNESVLELTDIQNADQVTEDNPLEIELNTKLEKDQQILPITFDGEHILLVGDASVDESDAKIHISIDHIPDVPDNRRSLGKALKLYFFKTYLKQDNVNQLCWVEYKDDGSVVRHKTEVADKVAKAKNIILLVHGIIGDTEMIAKGLRQTAAGKGKTLDQKFDLLLTYDYENLSTPISDTAARLKSQLEAAGINEQDGKKLTILAHSMGGLVSRWFIEQLGGNKVVDHLVMCGTPNNGSPFGKIDKARKLMQMLATISVNTLPVVTPFVITLLNRTKKITPTLEQMNPDGDFIKNLNSSGDPGIPYTILAGEIDKYEEPSDKLFPKLLEKAGKGVLFDLLFGNASHDIAVSVESILGVSSERNPAPKGDNVGCHHLNYFISEAGQKALLEVKW